MLLEREQELSLIERWLSDAGEGRGRIALVLGGAGLGKSSLLDQAAVLAAARGLGVLRARGSELESGLPFGLVAQLFANRLRTLSDSDQGVLFSGAAARARGSLGLGSGMPSGDLFGAIHGLYWLLANLSDRSPLLLTLDDLHWGDSQTRQWLGYLHPRVLDLPVLVLGAARRDEADGDELLAGVPVERVSTVAVRPFSEAAVVRLAKEQFGGVDDAEFAVACHRATGGNPFFLRELLRAADADGIQPTAANVALVPQLGSSAIARSIVVRLARLGGAARDLADAVAVLGANAELRHAAVLAGLSPDQALLAWDALTAGEILEPRQPLEFIHPIARTAIYREMPVGKRASAHRRAAEMLSADGAGAQQVGLQALACEPLGDARIVGWLRDAAMDAMTRGAPDAATRYLRRALDEPPEPALRGQVQFELGQALLGTDTARAAAAFEMAAATEEPGLRLTAHRWMAAALAYDARIGDAVKVFDTAIELAGAESERTLDLIGTRDWYASWWADDPDRRGRHDAIRQLAAGLAGATGGERRVIAIAALSIAQTGFEPASRALELVREIRPIVRWDDVEDGIETAVSLKWIDTLCGDPASAATYEQSEAAHAARGRIINIGSGRTQRAIAEFRHGALLDAEADARAGWEVLASLRGATSTVYWMAAATLVEVLLGRGALDEAEHLATSTGLGLKPLDVVIFPWPPVLRGQIALARDRLAHGIELLLDAGAWLERRALTNPSRIPWEALVAPALAAAGRVDEAREVIQPALGRAREFGTPWGLGMALRAAGVVEQGARGIALLQEAAAVLKVSSCRLEHATALIELGAALRRANQRAQAREHLRVGLDLAHRCGAAPLTRRAQHELRAAGARPRRLVLSGLESLTGSERRIAELAAAGMSNPDIAQRLFVTRKTVEAHLGHVYMKLDLTGRQQLPEALRARPTQHPVAGDRWPTG